VEMQFRWWRRMARLESLQGRLQCPCLMRLLDALA